MTCLRCRRRSPCWSRKTISVVYNPEGSYNELVATVRDIRDKQRLLARRQEQPSDSRRRHVIVSSKASLSPFRRGKKTPHPSPRAQSVQHGAADRSGLYRRHDQEATDAPSWLRLQPELACTSMERSTRTSTKISPFAFLFSRCFSFWICGRPAVLTHDTHFVRHTSANGMISSRTS
jgi:hypothetical protein